MALVLKEVVNEDSTPHLQRWDSEEYLQPLGGEMKFLIGSVDFGDVGYERKSDWMRLVNRVDNYNADAFFKKLLPSTKEYKVTYDNGTFIIDYKKPIKVVVAVVGDSFAVEEVTQVKGEVHWEWYSRSCESHKVLEGYCGVLEVGLRDVEFN